MPRREDFRSNKQYQQAFDAYTQELKTWSTLTNALSSKLSTETTNEAQGGAEAERKRQELRDYQASTLGQTMALTKQYPALVLGGAIGTAGATGYDRIMRNGTTDLSPRARAAMAIPYMIGTGLGLYKSHEFLDQSRDPKNTPLEADAGQAYSNAALGGALAIGGTGSAYSLAGIGSKTNAAGEPSDTSPDKTPPDGGGATQPSQRYAGAHGRVMSDVAADFGFKAPGNKSEALDLLHRHIDSAHEDALRTVAARLAVSNSERVQTRVDPNAPLPTLRKSMKDFISEAAERPGTFRGLLGPLALGLTGAAAFGGDADEAYAGPRRDESLTQYNAKQALNKLDRASYAVPYLGEMRIAKDIGTAAGTAYANSYTSATAPAYNPRSKEWSDYAESRRKATALAAAQLDELRQRYEQAHPHIPEDVLFPGMNQKPMANYLGSYVADQATTRGREPEHALE